MLEDRLNQDLKAALLGGDKPLATLLRGLKSALLYAKIASGSRDQAMPDEAIIAVLQKEAKKRQESADLYTQGGSQEKAAAELWEKSIIEKYLPKSLTEEDVMKLVDAAIAAVDTAGEPRNMGQLIGQVKQQAGGAADGATVARLVKARLEHSA